MPYSASAPFLSAGYDRPALSANRSSAVPHSPAMGGLGLMEDFPDALFALDQISGGPVWEHPFARDFSMSYFDGTDTYSANFLRAPMHKSVVGISDSNLWYTPVAHCHQETRLISLIGLSPGIYAADLRGAYSPHRKRIPAIVFRRDSASAIPFPSVFFGVGVLVDPSTVPGAVISSYCVMGLGGTADFDAIPLSDPWNFLDTTPGFVLTCPSGPETLTVTF